jgi:membrane associated rhomboid family serine protease
MTCFRLIYSFIVVFLLHHIANIHFGSDFFEKYLALSLHSIHSSYIWTFVTYAFLHVGWLHLLLNGLVLYFSSDVIEQCASPPHIFGIFITASFGGGCLWLCSRWPTMGILVGASAGIMGLLAYTCMAFPQRILSVLLFFVIPIRMRLKMLLIFLFLCEGSGFIFYEALGSGLVAHSAHLGGLISGVVYFFIQKRFCQKQFHQNSH